MKKSGRYILPIAVFIITTLFIEIVILKNSIMEIEWGYYLVMSVSFAITAFLRK